VSFLDADYSAIEARIVNWLAGQEDALERFRRYDAAQTEHEKHALEPYRIMASQVYGIATSQVNKFPQRFVGKGLVLGAGFGLGPPKFRVNCLEVGGYVLPPGLEVKAIKTWRKQHPKVVSFWYALEDAAKRAIVTKNKIFLVGNEGKLSFCCKDIEGLPFLLMKLPSGRKIAYPKPRISGDRITHFGLIKGTKWGDVSMWGGTLANNSTQGTAADVMANGTHRAEAAGYAIATLIHDQALSYVAPGNTPEGFARCLTTLPDWAAGLPVASEGGLVPFYRKD
jgi:DNA polymerase bacteriophage-type